MRELSADEVRVRLWRTLLRMLVFVLGAAALTFAVDFGLFRARVAAGRDAYGSVVVSRYYAVLQKNGKTSLIFDPPQPETCVNALFPHYGMQPCWYLRRHPEVRTDI